MTWYRTGTVAVTNGSAVVTGTGTDFVSNVSTGDAFQAPDGRTYEIQSITSATQLTLAANYQGVTADGQGFAIQPTTSFSRDLATQVGALISSFAATRDGAGQGLFASGTAAAPGVRSASDQDTGMVWLGGNVLSFATSGVIRLAIDATGDVGVGTSSPGAPVHVTRLNDGNGLVGLSLTNPSQSTSTSISLDLNPSTAGVGVRSAQVAGFQSGVGQIAMLFRTSASDVPRTRWQITYDGHFQPWMDNTYDIGSGGLRVRVVYAASGSINTSDAREKTWRSGLTAEELAAAREIAAAIGVFQFNDAIAEKGIDHARLHTGVKAQQVVSILQAHGLDAMRYAFVCHDEWAAVAAVPAQDAVPAVLDDKGDVVTPEQAAVAGTPARPAGDRYGIRYDEIAMFIAAAQEQRLAAIEAALAKS